MNDPCLACTDHWTYGSLRVPVSSLPADSALLEFFEELGVVDEIVATVGYDPDWETLDFAAGQDVSEVLGWFGVDDIPSLADVPGLSLDWTYRDSDSGFNVTVEGGKVTTRKGLLVWTEVDPFSV